MHQYEVETDVCDIKGNDRFLEINQPDYNDEHFGQYLMLNKTEAIKLRDYLVKLLESEKA